MGRFKCFFVSIWRFVKQKPAAAAVPAVLLGVVTATALTAFIVSYFKGLEAGEYILGGMSSYAVSSDFDIINQTSEAPEISSAAPAVAAPVIQPIKKKVEYKGKEINVAAVEVARPDSVEDNKNGNYIKEKAEPAVQKKVTETVEFKSISSGNYTYGIDVSSHNGVIDWAAVKASNVKFAMIRCGYRGYLTGKIVMDSSFEYNIQNAYKNGIPVGVYFYSTATNEVEATEEAAYVAELVKAKEQAGIKLSYPIAYDFEEFYNKDDRSRAKSLSKSRISSDAAAFLDYIKSSGYNPMFYAGKNPVKNNFEPYLASRYNFWLANYANATEYDGRFFMWQFTSSGQVNGINGCVDLNVQGFQNEDNLPQFSICKKQGVAAFKAPSLSSGQVLTLTADQIYSYRNTYTDAFKEIKVGKVYGYVQTADLFTPFEATGQKYKTNVLEQIYRLPVDDNSYKTGKTIPADTSLEVRGVWENSWIEIKYGGSVCYIKADNIVVSGTDASDDTSDSGDSSGDDSGENNSDNSSSGSSLNSDSTDSNSSENTSTGNSSPVSPGSDGE